MARASGAAAPPSAAGAPSLVALRGSGSVDIGDEKLPLGPEHLVKVDPGSPRVLSFGWPRVPCIGGVYQPREWSSEGE
jgi:hypothetical protein